MATRDRCSKPALAGPPWSGVWEQGACPLGFDQAVVEWCTEARLAWLAEVGPQEQQVGEACPYMHHPPPAPLLIFWRERAKCYLSEPG